MGKHLPSQNPLCCGIYRSEKGRGLCFSAPLARVSGSGAPHGYRVPPHPLTFSSVSSLGLDAERLILPSLGGPSSSRASCSTPKLPVFRSPALQAGADESSVVVGRPPENWGWVGTGDEKNGEGNWGGEKGMESGWVEGAEPGVRGSRKGIERQRTCYTGGRGLLHDTPPIPHDPHAPPILSTPHRQTPHSPPTH